MSSLQKYGNKAKIRDEDCSKSISYVIIVMNYIMQ